MNKKSDHDEWSKWWSAREVALEKVFGPMADLVRHSPVPFELGEAAGGVADVVYFREHVPNGVLAVTSDLIGRDGQVANALGNYELAICRRGELDWADYLISRMAYYTFRKALNPMDTMDISSIVPKGSTISALLFLELARFRVRGRDAGVLLFMGITADELSACRSGRTASVLDALTEAGQFPFTDLNRFSVLAPTH